MKVATAVAQEPILRPYTSRSTNIVSLIDQTSIYSRLATPTDREKRGARVQWLLRTKVLVWVRLLLCLTRSRIGGLCCRRLSLRTLAICGMGCVRCRVLGVWSTFQFIRTLNGKLKVADIRFETYSNAPNKYCLGFIAPQLHIGKSPPDDGSLLGGTKIAFKIRWSLTFSPCCFP